MECVENAMALVRECEGEDEDMREEGREGLRRVDRVLCRTKRGGQRRRRGGGGEGGWARLTVSEKRRNETKLDYAAGEWRPA